MRRASSMSLRKVGTMAMAALTSSPRLAALPSGLTKSFCTSTTISAAFWGSQRSFKVRKISIRVPLSSQKIEDKDRDLLSSILDRRVLSVIVLALQTAVAHRHDIRAHDFFSGQQTRQKRIEGSERVMQHA